MFWRFGYQNISKLDTLLDDENTTLLMILNEEDVLQECKAHHGKLIDFLSRQNNIKQLLEIIVSLEESDTPFK
jgi:hypothetical protein